MKECKQRPLSSTFVVEHTSKERFLGRQRERHVNWYGNEISGANICPLIGPNAIVIQTTGSLASIKSALGGHM